MVNTAFERLPIVIECRMRKIAEFLKNTNAFYGERALLHLLQLIAMDEIRPSFVDQFKRKVENFEKKMFN